MTTATPTPPPAPNWYLDPHDSAQQRWWSGRDWTEYTRTNLPDPHGPRYAAPVAPMSKADARVERRFHGPRYGGVAFAFVSLVINPFGAMSLFGLIFSIRGIRWGHELERSHRSPTGVGWNIAGVVISSVSALYSLLLWMSFTGYYFAGRLGTL